MEFHYFSFVLIFTLSLVEFSSSREETLSFSIKLIPRYSPESPLYQPNLTENEIRTQMRKLSYQRISRLASSTLKNNAVSNTTTTTTTTGNAHPDMIRGHVFTALDSHYIVAIDIGTPSRTFYLLFDIGSSKSWVQCAGCEPNCFPLRTPPFNPAESSTQRWLDCNHPFCNPRMCNEFHICKYMEAYGDLDSSFGLLGSDNFAFPSSNNVGMEIVRDIVFGCGFNNDVDFAGNSGRNNVIAGILSMGRKPQSFINQIARQTGGRFSYCLVNSERPVGTRSYLRFGDDTAYPPNHAFPVRSTPLTRDAEHYYVELLGISVNSVRLPIPPETFRRKPDGKSGLMVDTGTTSTAIYTRTYYQYLIPALRSYFQQFRLREVNGLDSEYYLCYRLTREVRLPTITFHLRGGDFDFTQTGSFVIQRNRLCLTIVPFNSDVYILGADSQADHRIMINVLSNTFYFQLANCEHNS